MKKLVILLHFFVLTLELIVRLNELLLLVKQYRDLKIKLSLVIQHFLYPLAYLWFIRDINDQV